MAGVATVTVTKVTSDGDQKRSFGTIAFSAAYVAGGDTITPVNMGLDICDYIEFGLATLTAAGGTSAWMPAIEEVGDLPATGTNTIQVQLFGITSGTTNLVEAANGDYHLFSCQYMAWGA
jgi:hypothetical protein